LSDDHKTMSIDLMLHCYSFLVAHGLFSIVIDCCIV
jgi:hypothetical protein